MSVKTRLEDAMVLWDQGRKEGAWVLVLVGAAATARKRYPRPMRDNESFKRFMRDIQDTLLSAIHPPRSLPQLIFDNTPLEDILYEHMRCNLVHEADLSPLVTLSESKIVDGKLSADLRVGAIHEIPDFWVIHMAKAVRLAPENANEFVAGPTVRGTWTIW